MVWGQFNFISFALSSPHTVASAPVSVVEKMSTLLPLSSRVSLNFFCINLCLFSALC